MLSKLWASEPVIVSTVLPVLLAALVAVVARYVLGRSLTVDELVALFGVAGLGGGAVARSQVVPSANVLPAAAAMMSAKKKEAMRPPPLPVLLVVAALALVAGCTPQAQQIASVGTTVAETTCVAILSVADPAAEPLCVTGGELAQAIEAWIAAHNGQTPPITTSATGAAVVPADLHASLAALPTVKARRAHPICPPGQVAP